MLGIDLTQISEFQTKFSKPGVLEKVFTDQELRENTRTESLAGIFAAKEAFFKALGEKKDWLDVWIEKLPSGQPQIKSVYLKPEQKALVSISHSGDYATAIVTIV